MTTIKKRSKTEREKQVGTRERSQGKSERGIQGLWLYFNCWCDSQHYNTTAALLPLPVHTPARDEDVLEDNSTDADAAAVAAAPTKTFVLAHKHWTGISYQANTTLKRRERACSGRKNASDSLPHSFPYKATEGGKWFHSNTSNQWTDQTERRQTGTAAAVTGYCWYCAIGAQMLWRSYRWLAGCTGGQLCHCQPGQYSHVQAAPTNGAGTLIQRQQTPLCVKVCVCMCETWGDWSIKGHFSLKCDDIS